MRRIFFTLFALCFGAAATLVALAEPAEARRPIEGAAAHPLVPLPPGGYITRDEFTDFAELAFPSAPREGREQTEFLEVEGAHTRKEYTIEGTDVATLRLYRSYLEYFENEGFEVVFNGFGDELSSRSGFTFIHTTFLAATPSTRADTVAYILVRDASEDTIIALTFYDRHNDRRIMVNAVDVEPMDTIDLFASPAAPEAEAEPEPAPAPVVQEAAELEEGLLADGRVVVDAILFAFDSDEILPESAEALAVVGGLMRDRPELNLLVVGHTDGVGSFDYNLRLSLDRAAAVVNWLRREHGIDRERLRPAGAGPMSPITTNRTEQGRTLNRRVELVEVID
ncbi:MAG: OmpA family protein [Salinarimonas sp.]